MRPPKGHIAVDEVVEVVCGAIAHGGAVIAHHAGRTLLVRHALPGEVVRARVTEVRAKIVRAEAIEVVQASTDRVTPPCPAAHAGGCGGCDLQHVRLDAQRAWKSEVIQQALSRAGVWSAPVRVESLEGDREGLARRTRIRWSVDDDGDPGLLRSRSHAIEPVARCLIASPGIAAWRASAPHFPGAHEVRTTEGGDGAVSVSVDGTDAGGPRRVVQRVGDREWRLATGTFWQVHPGAAAALSACALAFGRPRAGERWWDLYAGAGLFSAALAAAVGPDGRVDAVESSAGALRDARRALHDLPQIRLHETVVERWLAETDPDPDPDAEPDADGPRPDGVLLDPPRSGAGEAVMDRIARARPRIIVYVSCDPMTLARDLAAMTGRGYRVEAVRAFDTFPMTHHVETVAALVPEPAADQIS